SFRCSFCFSARACAPLSFPTRRSSDLYALEYAVALASSFVLAWHVLLTRGFDVIHACNPPDLLFLVGGFFKLLGKKFLFDHHDLDRKSTRLNSSHGSISYAVFCLKKKN